jgi:hypothetical protein
MGWLEPQVLGVRTSQLEGPLPFLFAAAGMHSSHTGFHVPLVQMAALKQSVHVHPSLCWLCAV